MKRKREVYENQPKLDKAEKEKEKTIIENLKDESEKEFGKIEKMVISDNAEDIEENEENDDIYLSDDFIIPSSEEEKIMSEEKKFNKKEEKKPIGEDDEEEIIFDEHPTKATKSDQKAQKKRKPKKDPSSVKKQEKKKSNGVDLFEDEYEDDDSDEDLDQTNTIGNIPIEWYDEYDHIGYTREGKRIIRKPKGDSLDELVRRHEDPNYLRTVYDEYNDRSVKISNDSLNNLLRTQRMEFPEGFDEYKPFYSVVEHDSRFPIRNNVPSKKSTLLINLDEQKKVRKLKNKIMHHGYIPSYKREYREEETGENLFHIWDRKGNAIGGQGKHPEHIPAPRPNLPGNELSYHPPPEYVPEGEERFDKMYHIPQDDRFIDDRLERCMELYLCKRERVKKYKKDLKPESLFPTDLPDPRTLRPYPEIQSVLYEGHTDIVRCISCDPTGQWLVSGDEVGSVRCWEVNTGRCIRVWSFSEPILWIAWNPNPEIHLFAVAVDNIVFLIQPPETGTRRVRANTESLFPVSKTKSNSKRGELYDDEEEEENIEDVIQKQREEEEKEEIGEEEDEDKMDTKKHRKRTKKGKKRLILQWVFNRGATPNEEVERQNGILCKLVHKYEVTHLSWHYRGDYFSTLAHPFIFIHQLTTRKSQKPFSKRDKNRGGKYQRLFFHPFKPFFYIATQTRIKVYDLQKQKLRKVLKKHRCRYISDVDIHPKSGEHIIIGGYDKRLEWFEVEIASKPCKSMKFHKQAIRAVQYHPKYPLFASCSDDAKVHIFHYKVYEDWGTDPLIVPLKVLKGHQKNKYLGVMDIEFHPLQPWIFSAGADHTIRLYTS